MKKRFWLITSFVVILALALAACQTAAATEAAAMEEAPAAEEAAPAEEAAMPESTIDCTGVTAGDTISMLYQWSGTEEERINEILQPFVDACGVVISPESTRDQALLDTKVQAGTPPDIAFWNVAQLVQYKDTLKTMDELGAHGENYADFLQGSRYSGWEMARSARESGHQDYHLVQPGRLCGQRLHCSHNLGRIGCIG